MEYVILPNLKFTLIFITNPSTIISIRNLELEEESKKLFSFLIYINKNKVRNLPTKVRSRISYKCLTFYLLSEFIMLNLKACPLWRDILV